MNKKIIVLANSSRSLIQFRYHLLKDLVQKGNKVIVCCSIDEAFASSKAVFKKISVICIPIPLHSTSINPWYDFKTCLYLFRLFKRERPDIVLNYTIKLVIYASIAAQFSGVKNIYSCITGLGYAFIGKNLNKRLLNFVVCLLYKCALKFNKKVFLLNESDKQVLLSKKVLKEHQICLINSEGIDLEYFSFQPVKLKPISFLFVGRLIKDKGIYEYIQAAQQIKLKYAHVRFQIAGNFHNNPTALTREAFEQLIQDKDIEYLGFLNDIRPALTAASVFVLPSYREGSSIAIAEALATGRAVISTDVPGCRELVVEGVNGFLVPAKDTQALVNAMEKFILQSESISKMGQASRKLAEAKYDVHCINKKILQQMNMYFV